MSHDDHERWHWQEGNKYAFEAIKTLLLLNGGAAVALLAFVANWKGSSGTTPPIGSAVLFFGLGALCAAVAFAAAYFTQLQYGSRQQSWASIAHFATYIVIFASILCFLIGLFLGWRSLPV